MSSIPTVTIKCPANKRTGLAVINECDFDPDNHERADEPGDTAQALNKDQSGGEDSAATPSDGAPDNASEDNSASVDDDAETDDEESDATSDETAGGEGGEGAGDSPVVDEAEAKSKARAEYLEVVGKQPGPKWDAKTILTKLEAHRAKVAAATGEQ